MNDIRGRQIKVGKRVRIERNIPSPDGMLYKNTIVKVDEIGFPDKDMRVVDNLGKVWYVNYEDVSVGFL